VAAGLTVRLAQALPIPLDVAFACAPGELLALVGPSGSGKTTVLRCVAGLNRPASGAVRCAGETWFDAERHICMAAQERRTGLVFQSYALFPHMSALRNVMAAMRHHPRAERAGRAAELLDLVNMQGLGARPPGALSGGQCQRVALARALAREPVVLLLDEPFSAVDQMTRRRLHRELAQIRRSINIPVVLVTHDMEEARLLADHLSVLHRGVTLQSGTTRDVMQCPRSAEVARLVDHRNVFQARVSDHAPEGQCSWIEWAGLRLECRHRPEFEPGTLVDWLIPQSAIVLHRRDRPSRGEHENPVRGRVADVAVLGAEVLVTMHVPGVELPLFFPVSEHVARRNRVAPGEPVAVSLLADGIHLMPARTREFR